MKWQFVPLLLALLSYGCVNNSSDHSGPKPTDSINTNNADTTSSIQASVDDSTTTNEVKCGSVGDNSDMGGLYTQDTSMTIPSYGLIEVTQMVKNIRYCDSTDGMEYYAGLDKRIYDTLSVPLKFTYNMIYGEDYGQNCDGGPYQPDQETRIYGGFPCAFLENTWSDRQWSFFKNNKDTVIALMKQILDNTHHLGGNFKDVIVALRADVLIPEIIDAYRHHPYDHELLTVLMLLMERGKYPEFIQSSSHNKLYKGDAVNYSAYLIFNKANEDLIIQRAQRYYTSLNLTS